MDWLVVAKALHQVSVDAGPKVGGAIGGAISWVGSSIHGISNSDFGKVASHVGVSAAAGYIGVKILKNSGAIYRTPRTRDIAFSTDWRKWLKGAGGAVLVIAAVENVLIGNYYFFAGDRKVQVGPPHLDQVTITRCPQDKDGNSVESCVTTTTSQPITPQGAPQNPSQGTPTA